MCGLGRRLCRRFGFRRLAGGAVECFQPCRYFGGGLRFSAIAEALQDLFHVLGLGAEDRHHGGRDGEGVAVEGAVRPDTRAGLPGEGRTDQVGEAFEDIDAHGAPAENAEAGQPVEGRIEFRIGHDRSAAGSEKLHHVAETGPVLGVVLQRPEQGQEAGRPRLDQRRHEDVVGAEANAETAQRRARVLVERLHVGRDVAAVQQTEILDEAEGDASRHAG